ncbi:MAG: TetR/AcrR family transcriptional regulator [Burkholderiales bacterium]|jgi:AcrR family transcriptional regulator|nr:MAG: TetR/AcrR family transcriptional regulator [Burkholderiales bacterium]
MKQAGKTSGAGGVAGVQAVLERVYPGARAQLKRRMLAGALACFNVHGIEPTTIEMILASGDASVGNLYHHFGSKEGLVAALFFCALQDQAALVDEELAKAHTLQEGVAAMVYSYVDWVSAQPELARFMFQARSSVSKGPHAAELQQRNRQRAKLVMAWMSEPGRQGRFKDWPAELMLSIIIGAAENYSRAWLSGRVKAAPTQYREMLAEAAWLSLKA